MAFYGSSLGSTRTQKKVYEVSLGRFCLIRFGLFSFGKLEYLEHLTMERPNI
jgi:hypothetical protein